MTLTKEDLAAIGSLIDEKLDDRFAAFEIKMRKLINDEIDPLHRAFKQLLHAHVEFVDNIELMDTHIKLIMFHLKLSPESTKLRQTLKKLE